ncbi:hypothetical protein WJX74_002356 [Apatococcus lobatus]|uniref:Glycoside hydrolase family 2 n=1 Tax=Apatococcus lobatus TaxID=904363 RepID=A0AAW1S6B0_9CHLO
MRGRSLLSCLAILSFLAIALGAPSVKEFLGLHRAAAGFLGPKKSTATPHHVSQQAGAEQKVMVNPLEKSNRVLPTKWTKEVNSSSPWPEYPRPQLRRPHWKSLNGKWDFDFAFIEESEEQLTGAGLTQEIVVPFPVESVLSGIARTDCTINRVIYRRTFTVPEAWNDSSIVLHFGAVDWKSTVWVNGEKIGVHRGGYDKFSYDITDAVALRGTGAEHEILVTVYDPTEMAHIAIGKQRMRPPRHPSSIWYTSTTGIWQTVWLEPVPKARIERLQLIPDVDASRLDITVHGNEPALGKRCRAEAFDAQQQPVGSAEGIVGETFSLSIDSPRLWSFETPYLYGIEVSIQDDSSRSQTSKSLQRSLLASEPQKGGFHKGEAPNRNSADVVTGYFGMRKISIGKAGASAHPHMLLNGEFVFQVGMLDQGFFPDGLYTAPTDEAMRFDLDMAKSLGYNMLRKHIKVEPDRWYYYADQIGILVWQDMPALFWDGQGPPNFTPAEKAQWEGEMRAMIEWHVSFPCIIMWVIFNEGWGQYETERVVQFAQGLDPSRLADPASGWTDAPVGSVVDMHKYVGPGAPYPTTDRAAVLGEFGGYGLIIEGHIWDPSDIFSYTALHSSQELEDRYCALIDQLKPLMVDETYALNAAVYTSLADIEGEANGMTTYDREVIKVNIRKVHDAHAALLKLSRAINDPETDLKELLGQQPKLLPPIKGNDIAI